MNKHIVDIDLIKDVVRDVCQTVNGLYQKSMIQRNVSLKNEVVVVYGIPEHWGKDIQKWAINHILNSDNMDLSLQAMKRVIGVVSSFETPPKEWADVVETDTGKTNSYDLDKTILFLDASYIECWNLEMNLDRAFNNIDKPIPQRQKKPQKP